MQFIIGYDISDNKRLQRAYRRMIKFAMPIQYSIFLYEGTSSQLFAALQEIIKIINKNEDDLRVYPLPANGEKCHLGKSVLPDGMEFELFA